MTTDVSKRGRPERPVTAEVPGGTVSGPIAALLVAATAVVPIFRVLPGVGVAWSLVVLGLLLATVLGGYGARPRWPLVWVLGGAGAVVAGFSSGIDRMVPLSTNLGIAAQFVVLIGVAPFGLRGLARRHDWFVRRALSVFIAAQTVSSTAAVAQTVAGPVLGYSTLYGRAPGLAGHPNLMGFMAGIALLVLLAGLSKRSPSVRRLILVLLAINGAGLVLTGSLSSMLSTGVGLIVLAAGRGVAWRRLIPAAAAAGAAVVVFYGRAPVALQEFADPQSRFMQVTGQTEQISTLEVRGTTYDAAWTYIREDPFLGAGLPAISASDTVDTQVHNLFLHAWYQGGLGLGLAVGLILCAGAVLAFRAVNGQEAALPAAVVVTVLVFSMTSSFFREVYYWAPFLLAWASLPTQVGERTVAHQPLGID